MAGSGAVATRRLFLMRHAHPAAVPPFGWADTDRPLTAFGRRQAAEMGELLQSADIDLILCSTAVRTRETAELLALPATIRYVPGLYNCEATRIVFELARLPEYLHSVLVVGHSPGVPDLAKDLADHRSDSAARRLLDRTYLPATISELSFQTLWSDLHSAQLVRVSRPTQSMD